MSLCGVELAGLSTSAPMGTCTNFSRWRARTAHYYRNNHAAWHTLWILTSNCQESYFSSAERAPAGIYNSGFKCVRYWKFLVLDGNVVFGTLFYIGCMLVFVYNRLKSLFSAVPILLKVVFCENIPSCTFTIMLTTYAYNHVQRV